MAFTFSIDNSTLSWCLDRLKEPSTYAGLAGLFVAFHVADANSWAMIVESFGIGAASLAAIAMKEKSAAQAK